jgi:Protein phosphatase 2C
VLITPDETLTIHVGDSAIVGRHGTEWEVLCWPENGEYASTTYFVTDDPEPRLNITRRPREHDAFALFSDGVGDLALSHLEEAAYPQFFVPMMRPVDGSPGVGRLPELSEQLRMYLASLSVCERTDDDKTLILISGG